MFIDTHAHLYSSEFDQDRLPMIDRAFAADITSIYIPNVDLDTIDLMHEGCEYSEKLFPMLGLHPCSVTENYRTVLETMYKRFDQNTYYGIGETGIDLHWDPSTLEFQIEAFKLQCAWAVEFGLPVIIHSRAATSLVIETLDQLTARPSKGIFHCFGGSIEEINRINSLGDYGFGIGGVLTFKNAGLAEILPHIPMNKIVLETDAPYLAPAPFRGKRNEPAYLPLVAAKMGVILNKSVEEIGSMTTANAMRIFQQGSMRIMPFMQSNTR
ncbi:MAG: TatD family hydrolase [Saprospiraceae bacterium]|nr:TatD family hydrolase [Saprospiraceae bacterium]